MLITQFYVLECLLLFWVIFRYIWEEKFFGKINRIKKFWRFHVSYKIRISELKNSR